MHCALVQVHISLPHSWLVFLNVNIYLYGDKIYLGFGISDLDQLVCDSFIYL